MTYYKPLKTFRQSNRRQLHVHMRDGLHRQTLHHSFLSGETMRERRKVWARRHHTQVHLSPWVRGPILSGEHRRMFANAVQEQRDLHRWDQHLQLQVSGWVRRRDLWRRCRRMQERGTSLRRRRLQQHLWFIQMRLQPQGQTEHVRTLLRYSWPLFPGESWFSRKLCSGF